MAKNVAEVEVTLDAEPSTEPDKDRGKPGFIDYITTAYDKTCYTRLGVGYDRRPNADAILAVVIHTKTAKDSFIPEADHAARARKESTHFLVSVPEDGKINIAEVVPPYLMALHAGPSMGYGYYEWDTISIGIIVLVGAEQEALDPLQWLALAWLIAMLKRHYPSITYIVRHSSIAQSEKPVEDPALGPPADFRAWAEKQ